MKILLAHGVLGFGVLGPFEYFNGIAHGLEKRFPGVKVATAQVDPIGSVADRAAHLAEQIVAAAGGEKIHIFAYSMGGLDTRFALSSNLSDAAAHVSRVVMIGTPHLGSQVADAIENGDPAVLRELPLPVVAELRVNQRALHDLTVECQDVVPSQATDRRIVRERRMGAMEVVEVQIWVEPPSPLF